MRANIEMMQALISRIDREITRNEKLDVKQVAILSGALESLGRASKTDIEMMAKARDAGPAGSRGGNARPRPETRHGAGAEGAVRCGT